MSREVNVPVDTLLSAIGLEATSVIDRSRKPPRLTPHESDCLYRAYRLWARAREIFGEHAARVWIFRPVRSMGGVTPLSLASSACGYELAQDTLTKIEYGGCA